MARVSLANADPSLQAALPKSVHWVDKHVKEIDVMIFNGADKFLEAVSVFRSVHKTTFVVVFQDAAAVLRYEYFERGANMVTTVVDDLQKAIEQVASQHEHRGALTCPFCGLSSLTERALWFHLPLYHINRDETCAACPSCGKAERNLQVHYHNRHFPADVGFIPEHSGQTVYAFALVVCRRPTDGKFLVVQEFAASGFWLPGGALDPGEDFMDAARREALEESGVAVELKGVLSVQFQGGEAASRMRVVFLAEPAAGTREPKTLPDYESAGAAWVAIEDVEDDKFPLRGWEPRTWFRYVAKGGVVYPLELFSHEH